MTDLRFVQLQGTNMPTTEIGRGSIPITFDKAQISRDLSEAVLPALGRVAGDAALLGFGKKLFDFGKSGVEVLEQAQRITAQTEAQLRATGGAAGVTAKDIDGLSDSMRELAGFDDEAARSAANVLLRFSNIHGADTFKRVEKDAADLAVTMGVQLPEAAQTLGQILQTPETAARKLRPIIGALSDAQQASVQAFVDQGDAAGAVGLILDDLEGHIGGAAEGFGKTLPGQVAKTQAAMKEAKEELVVGLLPAVELGAKVTEGFADSIGRIPGPLRGAVGTTLLLGGGILALARPVNDIVRLFDRFHTSARAAGEAEEALAAAQATNIAVTEGEAAAEAADAVAVGANTAAKLTNVGATTAVGVAAFGTQAHLDAITAAFRSSTIAEGEATTASLGLRGGLLGIAAGAAAALGGMRELGNTSDKLAAQVAAAPDAFDIQGSAQNFDQNDSATLRFFKDLATQAPDTAQKLRDAVAGMGEDVSKLDPILQQAASSQGKLNASEDAGADAATAFAAAQKGVTDAFQIQESQRQRLVDSTRNVFDAEQSLAQAQRGAEQAARGVADAQRGVETAERGVESANRGAADATERLTEAQDALAKAQQPADAETLGKAQLDLADAHLRVGDAKSAVTAAEKEAAKERKDGQHTAADVADADRKVEEAKNALQRAVFAETDAETALQDVQAKGTDQDAAVVAAKKAVTDATQGVEDANLRVSDALRGVSDAQQRVLDAQDAMNTAYLTEGDAAGKLAEAQQGIAGGAVAVNVAMRDQITALQGVDALITPGSSDRQHLDDYIQRLFVLAGIFAGPDAPAAPSLTPGAIVGGNPNIPLRDSGGPVAPRQLFMNNTGGFEVALVPPGLNVGQPDVTSMILTDRQARATFAGAGAGSNNKPSVVWTGDVINPAPETASSSVAHELSILTDRLAMMG